MSAYTAQPVRDLASLQALVGGDAHPVAARKVFDHVDARAADFIARSPFLLLATSDAQGRLDVSPKGDEAGFVWIENERTLWLPDRPGNRLIMGHRNVLENPRAGLIFLIPRTEETLRVNGRAELHAAPALLEKLAARGRPATLALRLEVEECFFHCAKAFKRSHLWQPEHWGEGVRVSFGDLLAPVIGGGAREAAEIDALVEQDYRERL